jgi:uncharacterized RmlC-like cupin family protein
MAKTKYGKHLISNKIVKATADMGKDIAKVLPPGRKIPKFGKYSVISHEGELGANVSIGYHCITDTNYAHDGPHEHDFHELLCFFGGNPMDFSDLGGEVHICLGKEQEKHVITSPTVVSIPPGLTHCPLNVARCDKPIVFLEISLTSKFDSSEMKERREKEEAKKKKKASKKK